MYENFDFTARTSGGTGKSERMVSRKPLTKAQVGALLIAIRPTIAEDSHLIKGGKPRETIPLRTKGLTTQARRREWYVEPTWAAGWAYSGMGGLPIVICRGPMGALNGYVGVPTSHSLFAVGYSQLTDIRTGSTIINERPDFHLSVHGGLTYSRHSAPCQEAMDAMGWKDEQFWWFGFDTAQCDDLVPLYYENQVYAELGLNRIRGGMFGRESIYRNFDYVYGECKQLAYQLLAANVAPRHRVAASLKAAGRAAVAVARIYFNNIINAGRKA
jgi:hypothetical protein